MTKSHFVAASLFAVVTASGPGIVAQTKPFVPVTAETLANPDPADWLHVSRTYDQQRFSPLQSDQQRQCSQLRMAWSRGLPAGVQESTPIVYRGVMYVFAPGASIQALDATNGDLDLGICAQLSAWCPCDRGAQKSLGIYEDMIYFGAPDGFLVAIDAQTGKLRWETKVDNGQSGRRTPRRRRQGDLEPHLRAGKARELLHRRERCAGPARRYGSSTSRPRRENRAATRGATCRSTQRAAGPWGLPGSYDPRAGSSTGASRIPTRIRASSDTAVRHRPHRPRQRICTATRPSRSTSRPASSSGTTRSSRATTGTPTTTTNAF